MATLYVKKTREELIAICKERKIKGYSRLKKDEIIKLLSVPTSNEESSSQIYSPSEKIEEFDIIFDVLNNKQVQKKLVYLYASLSILYSNLRKNEDRNFFMNILSFSEQPLR